MSVIEEKTETKPTIEEQLIVMSDFLRGEALTDGVKTMRGNKQASIRTRKHMKKIVGMAKQVIEDSKEPSK